MTPYAAAQITKDRLRVWQKRNETEQHACTPLLLVNVCHDNSGNIVLNTCDEITDEQVLVLLDRAAQLIATKIKNRN